MSGCFSRTSIIGFLGHDPEVRHSDSGIAICAINVGVTERKKDGDEWKNHTEWFKIVCIGKLAENVVKFLKKGRQIYAEGKLQIRNWEDREGKNRTSVEILASHVLFLGNSGAPALPHKTEKTSSARRKNLDEFSGKAEDADVPNEECDIPF